MPVTFFHSILLASSSHITDKDLKCFAYKGKNDRCRSPIPLRRLPRMDELHAELHSKTGEHIDDGERHDILEELAYICLCGSHNKDQYLKAAVHQWADELRSLANNSFLDEPATTPLNIGGCITLEFKPYRERNVEEDATSAMAQVKAKNLQMTRQLLERINNNPNKSIYLYLFGHAAATGVYKVGNTKHMQRMTRQHELCYPGLLVYCFNHCPNAELFEKLVHGEFSQRQRQHTCETCQIEPIDHKEWFEVPLEELVNCINEWSLFSRMLYRDDTRARLAELDFNIDVRNLSKDPAMLRKWAMDKVAQWSGKSSRGQVEGPRGSIAARRIKPESYLEREHVSDDHSSPPNPVPELSPGSSAPGTPDSLLDPPTPTPSSRIRRRRYTFVQREAILEASPTDSTISFSLTTTGVEDDSQITLVESTHPDVKPKDIFWYSMPGGFCSESTAEGGTPRVSVDSIGDDMPPTPTPVAGRKGSVPAGARPRTSPNPVSDRLAGVAAPADSLSQSTTKSAMLGLVEMMRRLVFGS
ncbi:hypothetical protein BDW68DRAFT_179947 [Aspergillus falconensis]